MTGFDKVCVLAGHGVRCSGLAAQFRAKLEAIGAPCITSQLANDLLPYDHPQYIGHCGVRGDRAGNWAVQNCNYLLVVGCSLHEQTTGYNKAAFAPQAARVEMSAQEFIETEWQECPGGWLVDCLERKRLYPVQAEPHATGLPDGPANIYEFVDILSTLAPHHATILTDAGCAYYIMGQAFRCKEGQRYLAPGSLAEMGWCMPACTGAAFGDPTRLIIGVTGDGSFQTNVHELAVWRKHNLNIKLFVLDNGGYSCIRATQENYCGGRLVGIDDASGVWLPRCDTVSEAYGIQAWEIPNRILLRDNVAEFLDWQAWPDECRARVCRVACRPDQEFMPQVKSYRQLDGMMTSGRLDEMWPPLNESSTAANS